MQSNTKKIESNAITLYVLYGVKVQLPLSASAHKELARMRATRAGIAEVYAAQGLVREPFESNAAFGARVRDVRVAARAMQIALEQ